MFFPQLYVASYLLFATSPSVLVDEAQFLDPSHIDELREITSSWNVPVICYGLRTDFRTNLFPGSQRLLELSDTVEEVKTTCYTCNKKAIFNLKHVNGRADVSGPAVQLGCEEKYFPTCHVCYRNALDMVGETMPNKKRKYEEEVENKNEISEKLQDENAAPNNKDLTTETQ